MKILMPVILLFCFSIAQAQNSEFASGTIRNEQGDVLEGVTVSSSLSKITTASDSNGIYKTPFSGKRIHLTFSLIGYRSETLDIDLKSDPGLLVDVVLKKDIRTLDEVIVQSSASRIGGIINVKTELSRMFPSVSSNFEAILKTLPGVSSNNELSSQYSVRGGSFDENLVYINDIEIYKPLLVRNGQQEGLSFINPELTSRLSFSAGGFEARYGDKLSSVLNVRYGRPDSLEAIVTAGFTGFSATIKSPAKSGKSYYLIGARNKSNQSILKQQQIKGSYQPNFYDVQALYHIDFSAKLSLTLLGNYNLSRFNLIPESRETKFGTQDQLVTFYVNYLGQEKDKFQTLMGASTLLYRPSNVFNIKWINSIFNITEQEKFDIEGAYLFNNPRLDNSAGDGPTIGYYLNNADNKLSSKIYTSELRTYFQKSRSYVEWGGRLKYSEITDRIHEFSLADTGDVFPSPNKSNIIDQIDADNKIKTTEITGFVQNTYTLSSSMNLSAGLRANYNSYTTELILSPRFGLIYHPKQRADLSLRFAAGAYDQPPTYKEFRKFDGSLFKNPKAQRSVHILSGVDYSFKSLGTQLKLTSEVYFKKLDRLVPYKLDNLRVRYFADQVAKGYATGADFNLSGEFVNGLESSFRLSLMKTAEDIKDDFYYAPDANGNTVRINPGYLKRPTDQRINFSIFFQDKLMENPTYKVHLNLLYGSALPVGPPNTDRYRDVFKIPAYKRVDIGFSKDFLDPESKRQPAFLKKYFNSVIAYAELFNLLNINNTVSYLWVKDIDSYQYAIPNYLTSRQFNFKIIAKLKNK